MKNKVKSFGSSRKEKNQGGIEGDENRCVWTGAGMTERPIITTPILRDVLLEQRICLLERLAECANEIKRIDEQLKLI